MTLCCSRQQILVSVVRSCHRNCPRFLELDSSFKFVSLLAYVPSRVKHGLKRRDARRSPSLCQLPPRSRTFCLPVPGRNAVRGNVRCKGWWRAGEVAAATCESSSRVGGVGRLRVTCQREVAVESRHRFGTATSATTGVSAVSSASSRARRFARQSRPWVPPGSLQRLPACQ